MPPSDSYLPLEIDKIISYFYVNAEVNLLNVSWEFRGVEAWETALMVWCFV